MAYTGRDFTAQQCQQMGLYTHLYATAEETQHAAIELATEVARQSGITLRGVKNVLNYSERHSPEEGMDYVATWNAAFIESLDLAEAVAAFFEKREPRFS
jgi:enoyl-CoA hydratase